MSPQAREVARLSESAARLPEVRDEIVGRLRAAVGQGTYQVDPSAVARAIVEFEDGTGR
jgi:flagellar biosynthesis anti-sigma factor FlgM